MTAHDPHVPGSRLIRPLSEIRLSDTGQAGRKAAALGELLAAGLPVPGGFVLTASALEYTLAATGLGGHPPPEQVAEVRLPPPVAAAIDGVAAAAAGAQLAVRSSGIAEDLPGMSYAGQYETVLHVTGPADLAAAVRACWASAFTTRVNAYQKGRGLPATQRMAVLIQYMVPATAAGVAFSANPVTGDRSEVMVNAVRGLGNRLVAGQVSPEEWLVREEEARRSPGAETALTDAQARAVAGLARRIAARFGEPQDIEWALEGDQLWLLQARPITSLPEPPVAQVPVPVEVPPGHWRRDTLISPRPWSPMQTSVFMPLLTRTSRRIAAYGLAEGIEYRQIGGWTYTRFVPLDGTAEVSARIQAIVEAIGSDEPARVIEDWYELDGPRIATRSSELAAADLAAMDDKTLGEHAGEVTRFAADSLDALFHVGGAGLFIIGELGVLCRDLVGWDVSQTLRLVVGLPSKTTEPAFRLAALARDAAVRPDVRGLLEHVDSRTPALVAERVPEFAAQVAEYLDAYGHRPMAFEVAEPTLHERPELVLSLIRDQIARGYSPEAEARSLGRERAAATREAREALAACGAEDRDRFERALARAQRAFPVRDDKAFYTAVAWALVRYALREIGRRIAGRQVIREPDDVFFLHFDEATDALLNGGDHQADVGRRRGMNAWALANPGPPSYGDPPAQAVASDGDAGAAGWIRSLPPGAQRAIAVMMWIAKVGGAPEQAADTGGGIRGVAASPGRYTGPARIITGEDMFGKLRPGDVLVCPETTPQWAVLFPIVGALVTDTGGLLSHPAIIAREYRVPAVVATGDATRRLRDGQLVVVDGTTGEVEVAS